MWMVRTDPTNKLRQSKNIYVGETRIATKSNYPGDNLGYEEKNVYWYHSDHLGSAQLVTNYKGKEHERIEYTPYGELWVEKTGNGVEKLPFRFTGKEFDEETGLYYYGARYLDPRASRWLSTDPALGEYIPGAPVSDEARKANGNLPGMGGVFNTVNLALYHYAGNNPVKYIDPDGREAGDCFTTKEAAAKDFAQNYNDDSIRYNKEYAASIYTISKDKIDYFTYTIPTKGSKDSALHSVPFQKVEGLLHTHAAYDSAYSNNEFSKSDKAIASKFKVESYVATPNGSLLSFDPSSGNIGKVSTLIPSDTNDPSRMNLIDTSPREDNKSVSAMHSIFGYISQIFRK